MIVYDKKGNETFMSEGTWKRLSAKQRQNWSVEGGEPLVIESVQTQNAPIVKKKVVGVVESIDEITGNQPKEVKKGNPNWKKK